MAITASQLRANIYKLLDEALKTGRPIEVERNGRILMIMPAERISKLARLPRREQFIRGDANEFVHMDWTSEWKSSAKAGK